VVISFARAWCCFMLAEHAAADIMPMRSANRARIYLHVDADAAQWKQIGNASLKISGQGSILPRCSRHAA
jgi:hypothetical protein